MGAAGGKHAAALLVLLLAAAGEARNTCLPTRRCNVLWFAHVPRTGGTSTLEAVINHATPKFMDFKRLHNHNNASRYSPGGALADISVFFDALLWKMARKPVGPLRNYYIHHGSEGGSIRAMLPYVREWKHKLKKGGCRLILATVVRQGTDRAMSAYEAVGAEPDDLGRNHVLNNGMLRYVLNDVHGPATRGGEHVPIAMGEASPSHVGLAMDVLKHFDIIGDTACLDVFWHCLANATGTTIAQSHPDGTALHYRPSRAPKKRERHPDALARDAAKRAMLAERNTCDDLLYTKTQALEAYQHCKPLKKKKAHKWGKTAIMPQASGWRYSPGKKSVNTIKHVQKKIRHELSRGEWTADGRPPDELARFLNGWNFAKLEKKFPKKDFARRKFAGIKGKHLAAGKQGLPIGRTWNR